MQEYFKILGLPVTATEEEIENAYQTLKNQYSRDRFLEGELGNEAARNLTKLETAYQEIKASRVNSQENATDIHTFDEVEELIKKGDIASAQIKLDNINDRSAEWHYLQSIIYYKQNWFLESKKQLEFAMAMDPQNAKFRNSYDKLTKIMASKTVRPEDLRSREQSTQGQPVQTGIPTCTGNCCCDMCLANSMCNCMSSCMHC